MPYEIVELPSITNDSKTIEFITFDRTTAYLTLQPTNTTILGVYEATIVLKQ